MGGRGKRKANSQSKGGTQKNDHQASRGRPQPKIVESVNDSDDEEIDEDEAFNSEDERMYGHFFEKNKNSQPSRKKQDGSDDSGDDESHSDEDDDDDDEGSDDDDDDDEEEDDDDGGQYMLDLLEKLESVGNKKNVKDQINSVAQMAKLSESEYSSSISKKGLTLDNLMEGLEDTQGFKVLQKTFANQESTTPAPLGKVVADRKQRQIVYENERKDITRWTKVVQENRQAETLDFKPKERLNITRETLVDKFEPTTEFEKELEQALEEAGQQDEEAVLRAEEQALQDDLGANRLTMEEYKKRRGQLAQIRALMFYHEQKRHHINKIKSKKYRRIRKKQRERMKDSALEAAMEDDEELAREMKEKEEVARIQERMTLAHKNTSKWAKRVLKRGKNVDIETRRALSAQLKRGDDLRRKMMGDDEDQSDNDSDEDLVESTRKVLEDIDATDPTQGKTGLFKLSFMQKGIMKQRDKARDETRRLLNELEANERDDYDDAEEGSAKDHDDDSKKENAKKKPAIASDKEMQQIMKSGELVATSLAFGNSTAISTSGGIEIDLGGTKEAEDSNDIETESPQEELPTQHAATFDGPSNKKNKSGSAQEKKGQQETPKSSKKDSKVKGVSTTQVSTNTRTDTTEEVNPWLPSTESEPQSPTNEAKAKPIAKQAKKTTSKKGIVDIEGAASILDAGGAKDSNAKATPKASGTAEGDVEEKKITMLSQAELIRRAFASSDKEVEEEFQKEKEAMAGENDPTRQVAKDKGPKEVAGWGSWVGVGAPPPSSNRKKKPLPKKLQAPVKKPEETRKRKDDGKPDVIINQKRLKKFASTFLLGDVPHPYSSRVEYEQAMLGGVGREWNVSSSFKNMTRPEILTRPGKIIQPISKKAKVARAPAKF